MLPSTEILEQLSQPLDPLENPSGTLQTLSPALLLQLAPQTWREALRKLLVVLAVLVLLLLVLLNFAALALRLKLLVRESSNQRSAF